MKVIYVKPMTIVILNDVTWANLLIVAEKRNLTRVTAKRTQIANLSNVWETTVSMVERTIDVTPTTIVTLEDVRLDLLLGSANHSLNMVKIAFETVTVYLNIACFLHALIIVMVLIA